MIIYFQVTDPKAATYEVANYIQAIEQLTVTTLRNVVGGIALETTLTSRDHINGQLRGVLDEATGKWGVRVNRVEIKAIDPPTSIIDAMEKQMRAERDKRAAILTAEGDRQAAILGAEGEAKAIETVFKMLKEQKPDPQILAYKYLEALPVIADGQSDKVWMIPSDLGQTLMGFWQAIANGRPASAVVEREVGG